MSKMKTETVEMVVRLKVRYEAGTEGARAHAMAQLPGLVAHVDTVGVCVEHGIYGAKVVSSEVVEPEPAK
jgi:hypothetical protein